MNNKLQDSVMKEIYRDEIVDEFKQKLKMAFRYGKNDYPDKDFDKEINNYIKQLKEKVK
jgi:hypothetical protein